MIFVCLNQVNYKSVKCNNVLVDTLANPSILCLCTNLSDGLKSQKKQVLGMGQGSKSEISM